MMYLLVAMAAFCFGFMMCSCLVAAGDADRRDNHVGL